MDFSQELIKTAITNGIFCLLFVWLMMNERKDSKAREERLLKQLETNTEAYDKIVNAINTLRDMILFNIKSNHKEGE